MIKNISIVVDSIDEDEGSGAKANIALIESLLAEQYNVTVYHYTRKEIQLPSVNCIMIPEKKRNAYYLLGRIQRVLARNTGININSIVEKALGFSFTYLNDVNSIKKQLTEIRETDLIITLSQGASFRPHNALLKMPHLHSKWMAYVHDPYPFHFYPEPYNWNENGYRKKEFFFRMVSEKSKYSAFPSVFLKAWMGQFFPRFLITGVVIPHQLRTESVKQVTLPDYFQKEKFTLLHAGNLMKQRSPEGLIKGFKLFLSNHPEASDMANLLLVGPASYHQQLITSFLPSTQALSFINSNVPFETVYNLQNHASVNVILEAKSTVSPFLPGKFPHCIMAGKPILSLAPEQSETKRLLGKDYPYWAEQDDEQKIAEIISQLFVLWKKNNGVTKLDRPDLTAYLSSAHLKEVLDTLQ